MDDSKVIFTGGKGLLGSTFRKLRPGLHYTDLPEFDVTEYSKMKQYVESHPCEMILHAAAFTSPPLIDKDPDNVMRVAASQTGSMLGPSGVDEPALAQSAIGQRDVAMTPLQGALIAAAIANNGMQMRPYLID